MTIYAYAHRFHCRAWSQHQSAFFFQAFIMHVHGNQGVKAFMGKDETGKTAWISIYFLVKVTLFVIGNCRVGIAGYPKI
jgi:hypothetical protein